MGDIGNAIRYLYREFVLRDILSFVMPGAIIALTAFLVFIAEPTLKESLKKLFEYPASIHWLFYILLFGLFYVVGFAVQCFGEIFDIIRFTPTAQGGWSQRFKIFLCNWANPNNIWWEKAHKELVEFGNTTQGSEGEWARHHHERIVVLKQMCANNFLAIVIAGIFILINQYLCASSWCLLILVVPLLAALFWGYRVHVLRQNTWEKAIISKWQKSN
jgi:hypothetical protein